MTTSDMDARSKQLGLFQGYGIELEYMIVDAESLDVRPLADKVLEAAAGRIVSDVELGPLAWSNELVLHVIELKTNGPVTTLDGVAEQFQEGVRRVNEFLASHGAMLLPTAMHPWMDPLRETRLWPHDYSAVYEAFHRIFDCRGHGWSNLQSVHLNLPFHGDAEFGRLHAAIRILLPILPALAASSPIKEGRVTGWLDQRLEEYRGNAVRIPSISAAVVPEPAFTEAEYDRQIFRRIYADIAPHDPEGILRDEFLNARGAIARFSRGTIEIRILDVAECPAVDLSIVATIVAVLRGLVSECWSSLAQQQAYPTAPLAELLRTVARFGDQATIDIPGYGDLFGWPGKTPLTASSLWRRLLQQLDVMPIGRADHLPISTILDHGPLARRIIAAVGEQPSRERLRTVYRRLSEDLAAGRIFTPDYS